MTTAFDWSKLKPRKELSEFAKNLIREISDRFIVQGIGTPDQEKRIQLGKNRHVLDELIQAGYIRNASNKYYPGFTALFFALPDQQSLCESIIENTLKAAQQLYKLRAFGRYTLRDLQMSSADPSIPMTYDTARLGAQFMRDFPLYFSFLDSSPDEPVSAFYVAENILDFESLAQAWEDETNRRAPAQAPAHNPNQEHAVIVSAIPAKSIDSSEALKHIFVIHGRDERLREGMFIFLRALGLEPLEWTKAIQLTGKASPYIGEILEAAFRHARAVVVLLTPDDEARLRNDLIKPADPTHERSLTGQARPNVLFEAGMALASHPDRTVLVQFGFVRPFSDVTGRHLVAMDNTFQRRHELAVKLKTAGCPVDLDRKDWQTVGDLNPPVTILKQDHPVQSSLSPAPNLVFLGARPVRVASNWLGSYNETTYGGYPWTSVACFRNEALVPTT